MLSAGLREGQRDVERQLQETLALLDNFQPTIQAPQVVGNVQLPEQAPINDAVQGATAGRESKFESDMRGIMAAIQSTIESVTQAIGQVARDTFAQFINPLRMSFKICATCWTVLFRLSMGFVAY